MEHALLVPGLVVGTGHGGRRQQILWDFPDLPVQDMGSKQEAK